MDQTTIKLLEGYGQLVQQLRRARERIKLLEGKKLRKNNSYYEFVPFYDYVSLFKLLVKLKNKGAENFLDVGAGIGNIVHLANSAGLKGVGIEYDQNLEHFSLTTDTQYIDAFDFNAYMKYDIIYMYCPIHDFKLELSLEIKILKAMKSGAYFVSPACHMSSTEYFRKDSKNCATPGLKKMAEANNFVRKTFTKIKTEQYYVLQKK